MSVRDQRSKCPTADGVLGCSERAPCRTWRQHALHHPGSTSVCLFWYFIQKVCTNSFFDVSFCVSRGCNPQPLARPKNATYDKTDDEEKIKLPFRPPLVVMDSWGAAFVARELAKVFAPTFSFSRCPDSRSLSTLLESCLFAAGVCLTVTLHHLSVKVMCVIVRAGVRACTCVLLFVRVCVVCLCVCLCVCVFMCVSVSVSVCACLCACVCAYLCLRACVLLCYCTSYG